MWDRDDSVIIIYLLIVGAVVVVGLICYTILKLNGLSF